MQASAGFRAAAARNVRSTLVKSHPAHAQYRDKRGDPRDKVAVALGQSVDLERQEIATHFGIGHEDRVQDAATPAREQRKNPEQRIVRRGVEPDLHRKHALRS